VSRGYVICTQPRSGSTWLAELAVSTGVLGIPAEFFQPFPMQGADPAALEAAFQAIPVRGATANGVYALRMQAHHFDVALSTRWAERLPNLAFVHLMRRDIVGQALSWTRALVTDRWRSTTGAPSPPAPYDGPAIDRRVRDICEGQARWTYYFARNGITPLTLWYEDVVADPLAAVALLGRLLALPDPPVPDLARTSLMIQRDAISDDWRTRYQADYGDRSVFHRPRFDGPAMTS
jgi:LPS sulfotransferase NodH